MLPENDISRCDSCNAVLQIPTNENSRSLLLWGVDQKGLDLRDLY